MKKFKLVVAGILLPFITIAQIKTSNNFTVRVKIANADKNVRLYLAYQLMEKRYLTRQFKKTVCTRFRVKLNVL